MDIDLTQKLSSLNGKSLWLTFSLTLVLFFLAPVYSYGYNPLGSASTLIFLVSIFILSLVLVSDKKEVQFNSFTSIAIVIWLSFL
ncbi:hypothetical protein AB4455_03495 [Vibrio sp. 10N.261.46.E12]|uniref:hypothetical protein n=1 Tax=unclassified Vibrio TaxID=2614977 RepID=UPI000975D121|nr:MULTISPECIES: hypothetical protein [unclassified Vibrio]OMO38338.1 hypothetical protein BH584_01605 [Vibrio sp. 10N.261.45.E1]PMJ19537.1 hypothetical protein BCU27_21590 [Vibrio sp. 10N.286.45.B6]PML84284.1 hypothetical protein BCT66_17810 [Vibrio sp. 10N.261.49.E11]PMM79793.1 hypothetical protein BCT46_19570 [Vibrio sp. 10N.261.46.E8]PMN47529.1 hypothetical protein BCT32_09480 [Vibrio sp. 10N.261.45.E11]